MPDNNVATLLVRFGPDSGSSTPLPVPPGPPVNFDVALCGTGHWIYVREERIASEGKSNASLFVEIVRDCSLAGTVSDVGGKKRKGAANAQKG